MNPVQAFFKNAYSIYKIVQLFISYFLFRHGNVYLNIFERNQSQHQINST